MIWKKLDPEIRKQVTIFTISGICIVLFYLICNNLRSVGVALEGIFQAMTPFLLGILFALILVPFRRIVERKWLANTKFSAKIQRRISVAASMLFMLAVIFSFFAILIPQLVDSISSFAKNLDVYMDSASRLIEKIGSDKEVADVLNDGLNSVYKIVSGWLVGNKGGIAIVVSYSVSFVKNVINFFIGIIVTMYLLLQEETFKLQMKKILYAVFNEKAADSCIMVCRLTADMFNKFIFGKALDSLLIGIICYFVCAFLKMPYSPLIGFVVGITNMIPIFGPFIGAVPCLIILVLIEPIKSFEFLIFIFILQQIDGNLIGPYILGDSMGLPTLWVMFAIIAGGSLFGIMGMFLGVPVFSVVYTLTAKLINSVLAQKNIHIDEK